ncbi:MAG: cyclic nucleotide-binding domain-containing protein [Melioribacteraceae bacterium]|nr:cyclic nucleotide-binding domain-containing protein [Melioribacteraceae bacterium]
MSKSNEIKFLSRIELFKDLAESDLEKIIEIAEERKLPKGEVLFVENVQRKNLYLIEEGDIELFKNLLTVKRKD